MVSAMVSFHGAVSDFAGMPRGFVRRARRADREELRAEQRRSARLSVAEQNLEQEMRQLQQELQERRCFLFNFFLFPKASLMLGFCFRFSLKVPGSDTSCDDRDKKGFPFRCAADRACDAGWGCRPGVRGWLGGRRCGAGWVRETGAVDARDRPKPPPSETGAGDARDRPKPPPSETGAVDAWDMRKPLASETGETAAEQDGRGGPS